MPDRLPVRVTIVLGITTIVGFGSWFYGYGVLLEPIRAETGWSEATLSTTYGLSLLAAGALATAVGRLLHVRGSRTVYGVGAPAVAITYLALSYVDDAATFAVIGVVAGAVTGALGYYAAVHTILAQLVPAAQRTRAITVNTLWGAFASPLFLPLVAWLVLSTGWRPTLRLLGLAQALIFAATAAMVPDARGQLADPVPLRRAVRALAGDRAVLALLLTTFAGGLTTSLVILYQVPVMVTAGLSLTLASSLAGARGALQLAGRLPMPWLIRRVGSRSTLRLSHALTGASCLLLLGAGTVPTALLFATVAGLAIGALIPVESIFSAEAVEDRSIGMLLGVSSLTRGIGAAAGPVVGGLLTATTGTRTLALVAAAAVALAATAVVPRPATSA